MLGSLRMQITSRSDSRYPVTNWPHVQLLHRCAFPTGVPFLIFSLPMTVLSNPAVPEVNGRGTDSYGIALPLSYVHVATHDRTRTCSPSMDPLPTPPAMVEVMNASSTNTP